MRILIADDDSASRIVLATFLERLGYEVVAVDDGLAAWRVLQLATAPRLAILDLMMPGIDGLELVRRVREIPSMLPPYLIMLSTRSEKVDIVAGLDAGANDYVAKPFDHGELRARVEVGRRMVEMRSELAAKIEQLRQAVDQIKTLKGIVPICASCKNIRDDRGFWNRVENYVRDHTEAEFSHAVCPDCMKRLYPQFKD
jgi:sigma-B regulation protein RsbU (phosphoserine phosphatase)